MTDIVDVARRVQYTGNGTAGPFSFSFQVNAQTEIKVFVGTTQKTLTTHYTVSLTSSGAGSVTFTSGNFPTSSETITIVSAVGLARSSVYTTGGPLTATALEADFDTNIMILQQSSQKVDRALAAPEFDSTSIDMTLPAVDSRKGKILGFNATTGNPEVVGETATVTTIFNAIGDNTLTLTGTITYGSLSDGTITITAFVDEDDMSSNSATLVPTQQSVKAYVDSQVTAQDLDATTDSGTIAIDLDSETLTIAGGEGIDTSATGNTITIAGEDASTSNKGVASFASADFSVSSGAVSIKSGGVSNDQLAGSIADSKLSTITTADKVSGAAVQIDGATDGTSITVADSDKLLIDDGGTTKYINASQLNSYISAEALAIAADNLSAGDAAVTLTTTSGNITIDAQANNSDIIFKGTDATADTTFLTISGADAGAATFNSDVKSASGNFITTGSNIALKHSSGENFFTATKDGGSAIYHDAYPVFSTSGQNKGAVGTTNGNTFTLDTQSTFLEIGNSGIAGGTDTGTVVLSATSNANDERIGDIRFANAANADDDGTDADGRMVARIQTKSVTSDSNAGDDSGGTIVFSTKPEAGSIATALTLGSDQSATFGGAITGTTATLVGANTLTLRNDTSTDANEPKLIFDNDTFSGANHANLTTGNGGLLLKIESPSTSTFQNRHQIIMNGGAGDDIQFNLSTDNGSNYVNYFKIDGGNAIFNDTGADKDFRVESDSNANMLFVDAGNNRVSVGQGTPSTSAAGSSNIGDFTVSTTVYPTAVFERDMGSATSGEYTGHAIVGKTSGTPSSSLAIGTRYAINGDLVGEISASNGGKMDFKTTSAGGSYVEKLVLGTTEAVFNDDSADLDFRIESDGDANMFFVDAGNNSVGIGDSAPPSSVKLAIQTDGIGLRLDGTADTTRTIFFRNTTTSNPAQILADGSLRLRTEDASTAIIFNTNSSGTNNEAVRIDGSQNFFVGKSSISSTTAGLEFGSNNKLAVTRDGAQCAAFVRLSSPGPIIELQQASSVRGRIGVNSNNYAYIANSASGGAGVAFGAGTALIPVDQDGAHSDNTKDVGASSVRFDDIHATNGTIQTSDENEKQDIASMTTAELAVGKRLSTLFKTFRWKDKVTEKGDKARTHSGIVAQQVKTAFEAEGLDATKYALFCSDTWTNDDGKEQTRLGVRYPQLLSFIASYNESRFTAIEARIAKLEGA